jgi:hypothetical protein
VNIHVLLDRRREYQDFTQRLGRGVCLQLGRERSSAIDMTGGKVVSLIDPLDKSSSRADN